MKSWLKLTIAVITILALIFTGANILLHNENKGGEGRPYRVEAERIAAKIENGEEYFLDDYRYITNVEIQENGFQGGDSDYLVKEIGGRLYRFDYSCRSGSNTGSSSGSGLGLYICRTLMRRMNGDIFADIQDEEMVVTTVFEIS